MADFRSETQMNKATYHYQRARDPSKTTVVELNGLKNSLKMVPLRWNILNIKKNNNCHGLRYMLRLKS